MNFNWLEKFGFGNLDLPKGISYGDLRRIRKEISRAPHHSDSHIMSINPAEPDQIPEEYSDVSPEDCFAVTTGQIYAPLCGRGDLFLAVRKGRKFCLMLICQWLS